MTQGGLLICAPHAGERRGQKSAPHSNHQGETGERIGFFPEDYFHCLSAWSYVINIIDRGKSSTGELLLAISSAVVNARDLCTQDFLPATSIPVVTPCILVAARMVLDHHSGPPVS